jgi:hypothetical protein
VLGTEHHLRLSVEMEYLLLLWIEDYNQKQTSGFPEHWYLLLH